MVATSEGGIAIGDCHSGMYSTQVYTERLESIISTHVSDGPPLFLYAAYQVGGGATVLSFLLSKRLDVGCT